MPRWVALLSTIADLQRQQLSCAAAALVAIHHAAIPPLAIDQPKPESPSRRPCRPKSMTSFTCAAPYMCLPHACPPHTCAPSHVPPLVPLQCSKLQELGLVPHLLQGSMIDSLLEFALEVRIWLLVNCFCVGQLMYADACCMCVSGCASVSSVWRLKLSGGLVPAQTPGIPLHMRVLCCATLCA